MNRKYILLTALALALVSVILCMPQSSADDGSNSQSETGPCGENVKYTYSSGKLTISGTGAMNDYLPVDLPWYSHMSDIKTVIVENGVTSVGAGTFSGCESLTSVTIAGSVTSIGKYAFIRCSSLESIVLPDSITYIGDFAFYVCSSLKSVDIPDGVTVLTEYVFGSCGGLESVKLPSNLKSIEEGAFSSCRSLKSVSIPESVTSMACAHSRNAVLWLRPIFRTV